MTDDPQDEAEIQAQCAAGRREAAATAAVRRYGPEIASYLYAMLRDEADADDAFSGFTLMLWKGLTRFRWECTLRTWAYVLARRAVADQLRDRWRRGRHVELASDLLAAADRARSQTRESLRTDVKTRIVKLREQLDPDDQTLLILRVDRNLKWPEIARVLAGAEGHWSPADEARRAASLRKRFQRVKELLKQQLDAGRRGERG